MERAIVLVSGGIDSAVSLFMSLQKGWDLYPLTFKYYMRPRREIEATMGLAELAGCREKLIEVDLPFLMEVEDLLHLGLDNHRLEKAPPTYVPARNLIFYSIAAHYAELKDAKWIVGGHNGLDRETFPDAQPEFFEALNRLLGLGLLTARDSRVEIVNPLQGLTKAEVIQVGGDYSVPLERTWSCSLDGAAPCGECSSCQERSRAYERLGLEDPLLAYPTQKAL